MGCDDFIQSRLGKTRLIRLIMAIFAIPKQVDKHIGVKSLTVLDGHPDGEYHRLDIIGIDMEYRRLDCFSDIGTIGA